MKVTKETTMGEMLELDGGIAVILMQAGMHCVGCPSSIGESLEEACMVHGLDADVVLANINEAYGKFGLVAILSTSLLFLIISKKETILTEKEDKNE